MGGAVILIILLIGVFWIAPIFASNSIGRSKGKENSWLWGLVLGWLGVLIVAVQSRPQPPIIIAPAQTPLAATPAPPPAQTKQCPQCAEDVQSAARVCRFCGFEFAGAPRPETAQ